MGLYNIIHFEICSPLCTHYFNLLSHYKPNRPYCAAYKQCWDFRVGRNEIRKLSIAVLPSWAGTDVTPTSPGEGSSDALGIDIRDWLMLLFVSLQKISSWLLLELEGAFGAQSPSGCFFWTSMKMNWEICVHLLTASTSFAVCSRYRECGIAGSQVHLRWCPISNKLWQAYPVLFKYYVDGHSVLLLALWIGLLKGWAKVLAHLTKYL